MAGYGMKRPYPGEWTPFPPPPPMGKHPRMQHEPVYWNPGPARPFPGYDGGYGGDSSGWGSKPPGAQGKKEADSRQDTNMDFTDDYEAFYGPASGSRGRGSFRGRGRGGQGQTRGTGKPSNQGGNQNGTQQQQQGAENRGGGGARGRGQQRGGRGQRGLPPNQWGRGRGRGQRGNKAATASVPPVHTLAKTKPSYPDLLNMSVAEKLHRFCLFLRSDDSIKINAIQTIMNAVTSTKLGIKVDYEAEELTRVQGKAMYTGVLMLDDTFIARGVGANKKDLKQEVFLKAYNIMLAKTVAEIYHLHDPGTDVIRQELEEQMKSEEDGKKKKHLEAQSLETIGKDMPAVFDAFVDAVKNMKDRPDSCISYIEQAAPQAHLLMRPKYEFENVTLSSGRVYFVGKLTYGDVVFGRGGGLTKKLCRAETYTKALNRMLELPVEELRVSLPEEELPVMSEANLPPQTKIKMRNLPLEERLAELTRHIVTMPYKEGSVNPIDVAAAAHGLTPMIVYRTSSKTSKADSRLLLQCDLYLDRILLASSEGTRRKECMAQVYNQTWEVLTTTSVETLLTQHKRITDEELRDPLIVDIITKGSGKTSESNTAGLKRYGHDLTKVEQNRMEDLVIVEHSDWAKNRIKNAFCILQFSCTTNGLMLHWETEAVTNQYKDITCKCTMFVQKQQVGESYADNRMHAKHLAATDALFKLYQQRPVIKITSRNDENDWIPFDSIQKEADKLRAQNPDVDSALKTTDEAGNPLPDPFIMKVITAKMNAFVEKKDDELVIGPGMALAESRATRQMAKSMDLKCDHRQHQGEHYFAIYEKMAYPKLVEIMRKLKGPYRKYELVSLEDLPKYEEVKGNVIHNPEPKDPKS